MGHKLEIMKQIELVRNQLSSTNSTFDSIANQSVISSIPSDAWSRVVSSDGYSNNNDNESMTSSVPFTTTQKNTINKIMELNPSDVSKFSTQTQAQIMDVQKKWNVYSDSNINVQYQQNSNSRIGQHAHSISNHENTDKISETLNQFKCQYNNNSNGVQSIGLCSSSLQNINNNKRFNNINNTSDTLSSFDDNNNNFTWNSTSNKTNNNNTTNNNANNTNAFENSSGSWNNNTTHNYNENNSFSKTGNNYRYNTNNTQSYNNAMDTNYNNNTSFRNNTNTGTNPKSNTDYNGFGTLNETIQSNDYFANCKPISSTRITPNTQKNYAYTPNNNYHVGSSQNTNNYLLPLNQSELLNNNSCNIFSYSSPLQNINDNTQNNSDNSGNKIFNNTNNTFGSSSSFDNNNNIFSWNMKSNKKNDNNTANNNDNNNNR
eukprot:513756_1